MSADKGKSRMHTQYRTVDTSTLKGQKQAENLYRYGWTCYRTGLFLMYFMKQTRLSKP